MYLYLPVYQIDRLHWSLSCKKQIERYNQQDTTNNSTRNNNNNNNNNKTTSTKIVSSYYDFDCRVCCSYRAVSTQNKEHCASFFLISAEK
jgi:hypothetical protein